MGCTTSQQARHDLRGSHSPLPRSGSLTLSGKVGDSSCGAGGDHIVSLVSSTLGSLELDKNSADAGADEGGKTCTDGVKRDASTVLVKSRIWSESIAKIRPRTPTETPPNEPENIDALELMAGLEDSSPPPVPLLPSTATAPERHSFSFYPTTEFNQVPAQSIHDSKSPFPSPVRSPAKSDIEPAIGAVELDPEILSTFREAMEELSPQHPCLLHSPNSRTTSTGIVRARVRDFQARIDAKKAKAANANSGKALPRCPSGGERKVVLYFTSLRGVRKTYEECCSARTILKGYGARVDERDVSMDRGFREELKELLGELVREPLSLPQVFANGSYLGGVEEVKRLHEAGEMDTAIEGCEEASSSSSSLPESTTRGPCDGCGDVRFVMCQRCSGSCKVYMEDEDEEEELVEEEWEDVDGGFRRCPDCNENGIVRCPVCC